LKCEGTSIHPGFPYTLGFYRAQSRRGWNGESIRGRNEAR